MAESVFVVYATMIAVMVAGISLRIYPMIALPGFTVGVIIIATHPEVAGAPWWAAIPLGVLVIALTLTWRVDPAGGPARAVGRHHPSTPPTGLTRPDSGWDPASMSIQTSSPNDVRWNDFTMENLRFADLTPQEEADLDAQIPRPGPESRAYQQIEEWKKGRKTI